MRISAYAETDVGRVREGNEDNLFKGETAFAVADGMGGHQAGEVASDMALRPIASLDGREFADDHDAEAALADAIRTANRTVVAEAQSNADYSGMGTTLTAVLVRHGRLHLAHVGDSRAYLLRGSEPISQLTVDHTLVEQLVQEGRLSRDEAARHPQRSVITRAIGVDEEVDVDTSPPIELRVGDQVLLCSDGLTGPVSEQAITAILTDVADGQEACRALIAEANRNGGPDNISVVLLRVTKDQPQAAATLARDEESRAGGDGARGGAAPAPPLQADAGRAPRRGRRILGTGLLALALLGLLAVAGWLLLSRSYFVGDDEGRVAIYQGLPGEVAGVPLHWLAEPTTVALGELPTRLQERLRGGISFSSLPAAREYVDVTLASDVQAAPTPAPPLRTGPPSPRAGEPTPPTAPPAP